MEDCHISCKKFYCTDKNDPMACTDCRDKLFRYSPTTPNAELRKAHKFQCISECKKENRLEYLTFKICQTDVMDDAFNTLEERSLTIQNSTRKNFPSSNVIVATPITSLPPIHKKSRLPPSNLIAHQPLTSTPKVFLSTPNVTVICAFIIILTFLSIFILIVKKRRKNQIMRHLNAINIKTIDIERHPLPIKSNTCDTSLGNNIKLQSLPLIDISRFSYNTNQQIGRGGFSKVYKGILDDKEVAVKVAKSHGGKSIHQEFKIFDKTNHPNILPSLGVHFGLTNILFLPLRNYSLTTFLKKIERNDKKIEVMQLTWYCIQVADGMNYLHEKEILHCDLKIDNILIKDSEGENVEISDFGCAVDLTYESPPTCKGTTSHCSYETLQMAENPEIGSHCSNESDIWSYGITTWEIYSKTNEIPKELCSRKNIIKFYEEGKRLDKPLDMPEYLWRYVILRCFDLNPTNRPSMKKICENFMAFQSKRLVPT